METLVSIILPTYNGAKRIKDAVNSVLGQSYTHWELLVVDDGSTDATEGILADFINNDQRITYIKNEVNVGVQKTLNKGLQEAKGDYIARIDDDDIWIDTNKLQKQVMFLEQHKDCVLVGTGFIAVNEKDTEIFRHIPPTSNADIRHIILNKNCFTHSSVLFKKSATLEVGGYSESIETRHIEDYDLWLKLGTVGTVANLPIYSVKLVLRDEGMSAKHKIAQFKKSLEIIKTYKKIYPQYVQARICVSFRLMAYRFFQMGFLRYFFGAFYKLYKNI